MPGLTFMRKSAKYGSETSFVYYWRFGGFFVKSACAFSNVYVTDESWALSLSLPGLELKSKWELLELVALPLSHLSPASVTCPCHRCNNTKLFISSWFTAVLYPIFTHSGSRIQKQQQKRGVKKICCHTFFVATNFTKLKIIFIF